MATEYYDRYWTAEGFQPTGNTFREVEEFVRDHVAPGERWLDVGCGDGRTAGVCLAAKGAQYTGADVSASAVAQARELGLNVELVEDAAALPFPDNSFDGAVAIEVLEHMFEPQVAAREILRVLKPGATLFVTLPNVAYWRRRLELLFLARFDPIGDDLSIEQPWRDPHIRFFTPATLRRMLESEGFRDVHVRGHAGAFVSDLPKIGRGRVGASEAYNRLQRKAPTLLGKRLNATAVKP
jgi:methionine biosynthesis protein MetW